jgi:hypothetical protein
MFDGRLVDVEASVHEYLEGKAGFLSALSDADRRLVENEIFSTRDVMDEITVPQVPIDQSDRAAGESAIEVADPASYKVVEHVDVGHSRREQLIDDL